MKIIKFFLQDNHFCAQVSYRTWLEQFLGTVGTPLVLLVFSMPETPGTIHLLLVCWDSSQHFFRELPLCFSPVASSASYMGAQYPGKPLELHPVVVAGSPSCAPFVFFFFKIFLIFIYSWQTHRERQRHRQREKQAPCEEPDVGLNPGSPGSGPGLKAALNRWVTGSAQPLQIFFPENSSYACHMTSLYTGFFFMCSFIHFSVSPKFAPFLGIFLDSLLRNPRQSENYSTVWRKKNTYKMREEGK